MRDMLSNWFFFCSVVFSHTMFPNASLPTHILTFSKDDQETKVVSAGLVNVSIILYTLTVVLGITGNSIVIWVAGFKLKVDIKWRICLKYLLRSSVICLTNAHWKKI